MKGTGVLFPDALSECRRDGPEVIRQPVKDGFPIITRMSAPSPGKH